MGQAVLARLRLIPDGPLHPDDLVTALIVGVVIGGMTGRRSAAGPVLLAAATATLAVRYTEFLPEGLLDRPRPLLVVGGAIAFACAAVALVRFPYPASAPTAFVVAVAGCAAVWATAPDTEPALIGGGVLAGATPFLGRAAARLAPIVMVVPAAAAVLGTIGRPERLPLSLALVAIAMTVARLVESANRWRSQRAGTPTTVEPGSTSMVTTAPAPTTAP